uniref:T9SS type B sorting domain-containing protein n=1 Tax=Flavobacterium sp. TaxID=239 RepID=UPI00404AEC57
MKNYSISKLFLVLFFFVSSIQYTRAQCVEIETILVDACADGSQEGLNELVRFSVGNSALSLNNFTASWPSNFWLGLVQNATTAAKVAEINAQILAAGGCGQVLEPVGNMLPANSTAILFTSYNYDVNLNAFGALDETIYAIFHDNANVTAGYFANFTLSSNPSTITRTLTINFIGGCTDTVTYFRNELVNEAGSLGAGDGALANFAPDGTPSYSNNGCGAPVLVSSIEVLTDDATLCPCETLNLSGAIAGFTDLTWSATEGSFSVENGLNTVFTMPNAPVNTEITITFSGTNSCAQTASDTMLITVGVSDTPTFPAQPSYCEGETITALPTLSDNGVTGSWSPALDNTQTTEYTFTPTAGQCASSTTLTIVIDPATESTFDAVASICEGEPLTALPTTSTNGFTGSWAPALDNTQTTEYTFTPDAGQCAASTTLTITVLEGSVVPTFDPVGSICVGQPLAALPTTSTNGITGSWSPALDNTETTEYTFTPNTGQCAVDASLTITVLENSVVPTFDAVAAICPGEILTALPTISNNGITGTWSPALNNTTTTEYTFTPAAAQCAVSTTLTITVLENTIVPTFDAVPSFCQGATLTALPTTSNNGITGSWSPALNNNTTTEYTFTPDTAQCAVSTTLTIQIDVPVLPTFDSVDPICNGDTLAALPTTSNNNISGSWTPALDNTATTTYTFTPDNNECATTTTLTIVVNPIINPTFTLTLTACEGANIAALPTTSTNGITGTWSPAIDNTQTTEYTFTPTAGQCANTTTATITINPIPTAPEVTTTTVSCITEGSVTVTNPVGAGFQYSLNNGTFQNSPVFSNLALGDYQIRVRQNSCISAQTAFSIVEDETTINAFTPEPYELCDDNNDGFQVFNLESLISEIIGNQVGVIVSFHETQTDANFNANAIPLPATYANIVQNTQTVYIRVQSLVNEVCFDFATLQLVVNPRPEATIPEDFSVCDNNFDGIGTFDLSTINSEVLGTIDPTTHTVTYYLNENNAISGTNPIGNIFSFNNTIANNQQIWVRVTTDETGCFEVVPLNLVVLPLPIVNLPDPISLCDENNPGDEVEVFDLTIRIEQMIGIQTGLAVTFHTTFADAQNNTNAIADPTAYSNTANAQSLHVRITNQDTGCFVTTILDIRVEPLPILVLPTEVTAVCDPTQDGVETVDLSILETDLLNGADDITITFYETEQDASNALNSLNDLPSFPLYEILNPFLDFIYIRAEDNDTGCYNVYMLELNVYPSPFIPETLPDLTLCDVDVNIFNGLTAFDLTSQSVFLQAAQPTGTFTIRYFETEQNAQDNVSAIVNTTNYTNIVNPQVLWVRVENNETGCFTVDNFTLNVLIPLVPVLPTPLTLCNEDLPNDDTTSFDLTQKDDEILNGQIGTVVYYVTEADREGQVNAIVDPTNYTNLTNAQTLFATVISPDGCLSETTLTILVLPLPSINQDPEGFEACDYTNPGDGVEIFDLTERESYILNNQNINGALTIVYYPSEEDALAMTNAIANPSAYNGSGTVYVAVSNFSTNYQTTCTVYAPITLTVYPLPELLPTIPDFTQCEGGSDGFMDFDLQSYNSSVLAAGLDPADFNFTYYGSLADANLQTNPLPDVYTNTTAFTETIFVYVTNATTNCGSAIGSFVLEVQEGGVLNPINDVTNDFTLTVCDYDGDNNGITTFDLDSYVGNVLDTQDPTIFSIDFYTNEADAIAQTNPIADTANFETDNTSIWVVISNNVNSCYYYQEVVITVNEIPVPILTADNPVCIDQLTGDVVREATLFSGLDPTLYTFEWLDDLMNVVGTESTYSATAAGDYSIIATEIATGCMSDIQTITVIESAQAVVTYQITNAFAETQTIEATALAFSASEYVYQLDDGPVQETGLFENVGPGDHTLYVYDLTGCQTAILTISAINYPYFFTPNGDGFNDTWNIIGLGDQPTAKIFIFDRYGKLIKQLSGSRESDGWDGTYNGRSMPSDDYWFTVDFEESDGTNKTFKANFTL